MKKIKFGVVGFGHIGRRHVKCILDNDQAQFTSIFDVLPKNELSIPGGINISDSFESFLETDSDVVSICTPNYLHAKMAKKCLLSGKHVLIEKPMTLSSGDGEEIINIANETNKLVFCVMQNRFSPTMIWLKQIITTNLLGEIYMVSVNCFWNRNKVYYTENDWHGSITKDGGPLFTQFSHFIDILYWLFGDVEDVIADFFSFNKQDYIEFEDSGIVKIHFKNNIVAALNYSTAVWNKNFESSITIIGECGSVKIGGQYMDKVLYCDIKDYSLPEIDTNIQCNDYGGYTGSASNHDKIIDNVVRVLMDENISIHTNAVDGLNVVKIIEKIYRFRNLK